MDRELSKKSYSDGSDESVEEETINLAFILSRIYRGRGFKMWSAIFLGVIAVVSIVGLGAKSDFIMSVYKNNYDLILFGLFLLLSLFFIIYLIISLKNFYYRPIQLKRIAERYHLNYTKTKERFFIINKPSVRKRNLIEGKINTKTVKIFDAITEEYVFGIGAMSHKTTIISLNGEQKIYTGLFDAKKIDILLSDLKRS